jgi:Asp-tRNA(Asn)/Glu-tRNA(Gln) amidotransferase A subunit family amidase
MPQTTITLLDQTNLTKITKEVERAMKRGVKKATDSGATWVKEEIFNGQKFVGDKHYPNVKKETQRTKAKKGQEKVGIMTGNLRDSFDTHYSSDGMTGTIRGGGEGYDRFLARWRIDKLFYEHRAGKSKEIIDKEIKKAL